MKLQELEALVVAMGDEMSRVEAESKAVITGLVSRIDDLGSKVDAHRTSIEGLEKAVEEMSLDSAKWVQNVTELCAVVDGVKAKVEGRNKSAAVQRNMTDADALRVLNGDLKDMAHKDAGEACGLTYAQVYSCRLAYTFKHVHRDLEKAGWKSPWEKG